MKKQIPNAPMPASGVSINLQSLEVKFTGKTRSFGYVKLNGLDVATLRGDGYAPRFDRYVRWNCVLLTKNVFDADEDARVICRTATLEECLRQVLWSVLVGLAVAKLDLPDFHAYGWFAVDKEYPFAHSLGEFTARAVERFVTEDDSKERPVIDDDDDSCAGIPF